MHGIMNRYKVADGWTDNDPNVEKIDVPQARVFSATSSGLQNS